MGVPAHTETVRIGRASFARFLRASSTQGWRSLKRGAIKIFNRTHTAAPLIECSFGLCGPMIFAVGWFMS